MVFAQLAGSNSLREICGGLASAQGKLVHLGVTEAPRHSSLGYANAHRPWQLYESLYHKTMDRLADDLRGMESRSGRRVGRLRLKSKVVLLDATMIQLCLGVFDWAKYRRKKGAVKVHLALDYETSLPSFALVTEGRKHEVKVARSLAWQPGTILVFDRGYVDYAWFGELVEHDVEFVTRLKRNASYEVLQEWDVPRRGAVLSDQLIRLDGVAGAACPHELRRVEVWDAEEQKSMVFITSLKTVAASTVGELYRRRWEIETFFKALKQNLKIKSFLGTTANAVQTQIWTALLAMLLLRYLQLRSRLSWALSNLLSMLRLNLLVHRDLWEWIDRPFKAPPSELPGQGVLAFG
jgi:hypothetical protein